MAGTRVPSNKPTQLVVVSLLTAFCLLGIWTLFESIPLFMQASAQTLPSVGTPQSQPVAPRESADIEAKSKDLDRQIIFIEKRMDYIEKLLAALVTVGTIFGLALGLASYANLKELQQNAKETVQNAKDTVDDVRKRAEKDLAEIRADFPAIAGLSRQVEKILTELKSMVFREWNQTSYTQLPEREKQEIILLELAFRNVLVLFEHRAVPVYSRMVLEIHRGFGRFYSSRYTSSTGSDAAARARAILYLESASVRQEPDVYADVQGDLGILYALQSGFTGPAEEQKDLRKEAAEFLRRALEYDPKNPRILRATAWIERREGQLDLAIQRLTTSIKNLAYRELEDGTRRRYLWPAQYDRACYRVQNVKHLPPGDLVKVSEEQKALTDLEAARNTALQYDELKDLLKALRNDLRTTGDLSPLEATLIVRSAPLSASAWAASFGS